MSEGQARWASTDHYNVDVLLRQVLLVSHECALTTRLPSR